MRDTAWEALDAITKPIHSPEEEARIRSVLREKTWARMEEIKASKKEEEHGKDLR